MPTYTHECDTCKKRFTLLCSIAERDTPKPCAEVLSGATSTRVLSGEKGDTCNLRGTLTRPAEDIDITAATPYAWRP